MSHTTGPFAGSWVNPGPVVRRTDFRGCTALGDGPNYPVSDPNTQSPTLTLEPAGPLLDGATAEPGIDR